MTSLKPDDAPIPLTDDLGDTRALLTPERDPVTGARVAGAVQRAAKHTPTAAAPPSENTPRRRPRWPVPVGVGAVVLVGAVLAFAATRHRSSTSDREAAPSTAVATTSVRNTATTVVRPTGPTGPLVGFDGTYQIRAENVHISGSSGGFASAELERNGASVVARYDDAGGSATVELPEGSAAVTCAADGWTCTMQWAGTFPVVLDGSLGRAVLQRADGTPLGRSVCDLPIPSDGSVIPQFGLVNRQPQVEQFRIATGTATGAADGCANAVVVAYDLVATRAP